MSRAFGGMLLTTLSPMRISPLVISSRPASIRKSVVLPQPEGPTSTTNSPSLIVTLTPCTTSTRPKDFLTSFSSTEAMHDPLVQM